MRLYLLGRLEQGDAEQLELRLLTDPIFCEEFDTVVDEIAAEYAGGEVHGEERKQVEQHFLKATERRNKTKFISALIDRASAAQDANLVAPPLPASNKQSPTLRERFLAFWRTPGLGIPIPTAAAAVLIVAGLGFLVYSLMPKSQNYALLELPISYADRSEGAETKRVKITPGMDGLRISLLLPELPEAKGFRVESFDEAEVKRTPEIIGQDSRTITIVIPAADLTRGRYRLQLSFIKPDGTEQRVRGTYAFNVE